MAFPGSAGRACVAALLVSLGVGCADSNEPTSAPTTTTSAPTTTITAAEEPTPVGGLVATLGTNRLYALDHAFGLLVQNVGAEPVVVREVRLESDLFAPAAPAVREVVLEPGGRRISLPLPYGEARCDDEGTPGTFGVAIVVGDGEELRLQAAEEYHEAIARLHGRECAAAHVRELADIRFGDEWTRDGVTITGELLVDQRAPGPSVAIDDAAGNVIFTVLFEDDADPIVEVNDDAPSASVPVTISADRCDPHALAEVKQPFLFLTWVVVDAAAPVPVELPTSGGARAALEDLFASCR